MNKVKDFFRRKKINMGIRANDTIQKISKVMRENKGAITMVEIVAIIVVVLIILIVVFFPFIKDWFENTLTPMFTELTQKLFSLVG